MPSTRAFLHAFFRPRGLRTLGTPTVSQHALVEAVCEEVEKTEGMIVELGAGDGAITVELAQRFPDRKIVAMELVPELAEALARRCPTVTVWQGSAEHLSRQMETTFPNAGIGVLISGIPFRSLPKDGAKKIVQQWTDLLTPGKRVLQYTYFPGYLVRHPFPGFRFLRMKRIWRHVPPAGLVTFERL